MSEERKEISSNSDENVGLLFGYHKDMYRDGQQRPSMLKQCCAIYCARGSVTSWVLSFSIGIMIVGILCTVYGYYLPEMYLSLSSDIDGNMTMIDKNQKHFEKEAKNLRKMYHDKDAFIVSGLVIVFLGGIVISLSLLLPLCLRRGVERIPFSSQITVKNELGSISSRKRENCISPHIEETSN